MIGAFKALPAPVPFREWTSCDMEGQKLRSWLGERYAGKFTAAELIILSRLPEYDYFQPEEVEWMRNLQDKIRRQRS